MTASEAAAANLKRAHECLVEAKNCANAASQQGREDATDLTAVLTMAIREVASLRFD